MKLVETVTNILQEKPSPPANLVLFISTLGSAGFVFLAEVGEFAYPHNEWSGNSGLYAMGLGIAGLMVLVIDLFPKTTEDYN